MIRRDRISPGAEAARVADFILFSALHPGVGIPQGDAREQPQGTQIALQIRVLPIVAGEIGPRIARGIGEFQLGERQVMIDSLPEEVFELGKKLPVEVRKQFTSAMSQWEVKPEILYNPKSRFIDYVTPGIIGLILQLLTVTLMACTFARERESGC